MKKSEEKALIESIRRGEWQSSNRIEEEKSKLINAASRMKKDARINIRISSSVLEMIRQKAAKEGVPYQTLISSILYKYANGA